MSHDPLVPLTLRVQRLESQVIGAPSSYDVDRTFHSSSGFGGPGARSVTRRVQGIQDGLERVGGESEALKRLLKGYEGYRHLLSIPGTESDDAHAHTHTRGQDANTDLGHTSLSYISDSAKVAILVEARGDVVAAERDLREVEMMKERGVHGSGNLQEILPYAEQVEQRAKPSRARGKELSKAKKDVGELSKRYNEFTTTVSDMFLDLHHKMEALEEGVSKVERAKRKEMNDRY